MVKIFRITGRFMMGREMRQFTKECRADDEDAAIEFVLSDLGSKHRTPRNKIEIQSVSEVTAGAGN